MKLSGIYSNKPEIFQRINFNDTFNVILGDVKVPKNKERDSHNLGKTLLISIIDFLLLKKITPNHFFKVNSEKFRDFVFYGEIALNSGEYLTIKRGVIKNTKVSIKIHNEKHRNYCLYTDWDYEDILIKEAKQKLDELLNLSIIKPFDYRKGLGYLLRTQADYNDLFKLASKHQGKDKDWKPYLAKILGLDSDLIEKKYCIEDEITPVEDEIEKLKKKIDYDPKDYDRLKGKITLIDHQIEKEEGRYDRFNFYMEENEINKELVDKTENQITANRNRLYNLDYEIEQIQKSLESGIDFNFKRVEDLFSEAKIYFPDQLAKEYKDLVNFHTLLNQDRNERLTTRLKELTLLKSDLENDLQNLNEIRQDYLSFLRDKDVFRKFKTLQGEIIEKKALKMDLESDFNKICEIIDLEKKKGEKERFLQTIVDKVNEEIIKNNSEIYEEIRITYNELVRNVIDKNAELNIELNKKNNITFSESITESIGKEKKKTSQSEGTSYKQILCACFDLAILKTYYNKKFYHFVYHDGVLERLDDRKKEKYLEVVRKICEQNKVQYIFTAIDSDLPFIDGKKLSFKDEEVVLRLHDKDDSGRIFKMPVF